MVLVLTQYSTLITRDGVGGVDNFTEEEIKYNSDCRFKTKKENSFF